MRASEATLTHTSRARLGTLVLLCGLSVLPLNIALPSLPSIGSDLHASYALTSSTLSAYAVCAALMEMFMGPLSDRFGRRTIVLFCLTVFVAGSLGCAVATTIKTFLEFRLLQATVTSLYPVTMAAIRDTGSKEETASRIGYAAMASALAPMIGPAVGGSIAGLLGWRAIFGLLGMIGAAVLFWCWSDFDETRTDSASTLKQQVGAYPALLRDQRFWAYSLCMSFSTGTFYAFLAGAPLAAKVLNLPSSLVGAYMGSITVGFMFGSFLSGRSARFNSLTTTMVMGRIVACAGPALALLVFISGSRDALGLFAPCILIGVGNGVSSPCASAGALSVRPDLAGSASGLAGAITIAGGAALATLTGLVLTEVNAAYVPIWVMLGSSVAALAAALWAGRCELSTMV